MSKVAQKGPAETMSDDTLLGPSRRTILAGERTWLAWFRTGIAVSAAAVAVGGVIPRLVEGSRWPFVAIGIGYAILTIAVFWMGLRRYREIEDAIEHGNDLTSSATSLTWLTLGGAFLALATVFAITFQF